MSKYRLLLIGLVSWLFAFYNIERIHEPFNIASFVYVLCAAGSVIVLATRRPTWKRTTVLFSGAFAVLLVLKWQWGYPIIGTALPITITETVALLISLVSARYLALHLWQFEEGARDLSLTRAWDANDFKTIEPQMYREVRRARHFERPCSLAYLRTDREHLAMAVHSMIHESQQESARKYAVARIGETIAERLGDSDLIARQGDSFVVLLPETTGQSAQDALGEIRKLIQKEYGVELSVGVAQFPDQEITLTGLLDRAQELVDAEPTHAGNPPIVYEASDRESPASVP